MANYPCSLCNPMGDSPSYGERFKSTHRLTLTRAEVEDDGDITVYPPTPTG